MTTGDDVVLIEFDDRVSLLDELDGVNVAEFSSMIVGNPCTADKRDANDS